MDLTPETVRKIAEWALSGDTGISSETIVRVAMGISGKQYLGDEIGLDAPYDVSDFGRCYRLLEKIPELRPAVDLAGKSLKVWKPIAKAWDELTALYRKELSNGRAPLLYTRLRELRGRPCP